MEENRYLRYCQKHGRLSEDAVTCPKCGRETVQADFTREQYFGWLRSGDEDERAFAYRTDAAFKVGLDRIVADLRSGKRGKVEKAVDLLACLPQREEYIPEVVKWWGELRGNRVAFYLSRCSYESVRPYLDFAKYWSQNRYSVKVFLPFFLEKYKHHATLPCEECKKETDNLFLKIRTDKEVLSAVRHAGYVKQEVQYNGYAVPHAYCDECALKKAGKKKQFRDLSDEEKIKAWMSYNTDYNCKGFGGETAAFFEFDTTGFNYEYLITEEAAEEMAANELDRAVLAGMIKCAQEIKEKLEGIE